MHNDLKWNEITERLFLLYRAKTQEELGQALDVSQDLVSKWMRGRARPNWDLIARVVAENGISWEWLMTGKTVNVEKIHCAFFPKSLRSKVIRFDLFEFMLNELCSGYFFHIPEEDPFLEKLIRAVAVCWYGSVEKKAADPLEDPAIGSLEQTVNVLEKYRVPKNLLTQIRGIVNGMRNSIDKDVENRKSIEMHYDVTKGNIEGKLTRTAASTIDPDLLHYIGLLRDLQRGLSKHEMDAMKGEMSIGLFGDIVLSALKAVKETREKHGVTDKSAG